MFVKIFTILDDGCKFVYVFHLKYVPQTTVLTNLVTHTHFMSTVGFRVCVCVCVRIHIEHIVKNMALILPDAFDQIQKTLLGTLTRRKCYGSLGTQVFLKPHGYDVKVTPTE